MAIKEMEQLETKNQSIGNAEENVFWRNSIAYTDREEKRLNAMKREIGWIYKSMEICIVLIKRKVKCYSVIPDNVEYDHDKQFFFLRNNLK